MRKAKTSNPTNRSIRYATREARRARSPSDWRWIRHSGFVQEERNPLFDIGVVSGRAAPEFVTTVDLPDELCVTECGDVDVARAFDAAGVCFHAWLLSPAHARSGNRDSFPRSDQRCHPSTGLRRSPPPLAQPEQHHDDGAREQEVNGPAQGVTTPQPKHPQNSQY
jgi:hypothetical protein